MISDAYVDVECNRCEYHEQVQLTATEHGGYDCRNIPGWLKRNGWTGDADGNEHLCPDCQEKAKRQTASKRKRRSA